MATELNFENRRQQPVGGNQYTVKISQRGVDLPLPLGVDEVSGLGLGRINTVPHRKSGGVSFYKKNYPVGVEVPEVTFTGLYVYDFSDIIGLRSWHGECMGEITGDPAHGIVNIKRDIIIQPTFRNWEGDIIDAPEDIGRWQLYSCICTDLNISNFASEGADFSTWTMTVKPEKTICQVGGGS